MNWIHTPIYYGLDAVDLLVLLVCGMAASALTYLITERIKGAVPRRWRVAVPFLVSTALTAIGLPLVIDGLGEHGVVGLRMVGAVLLCSVAGGLVAKGAHDWGVDILRAGKARLLSLISGGGQ